MGCGSSTVATPQEDTAKGKTENREQEKEIESNGHGSSSVSTEKPAVSEEKSVDSEKKPVVSEGEEEATNEELELVDELSVFQYMSYDEEKAKEKFAELDADNNGVLEGEEIGEFVAWVYSAFRPDGQTIPDATKSKLVDRLVKKLDDNADGVLQFEECNAYMVEKVKEIKLFEERAKKIQAVQRGKNVRKEAKQEQNAATKIQAVQRGKRQRKEMQEEENAATKIQAVHRGKTQRKDLQEDAGLITEDVEFNSAEAKAKFDELDTDSNGVLDGEEIDSFIEWVYMSFRPANSEPMKEDTRKKLRERIMKKLDTNEDNMLQFDEFEGYFVKKLEEIKRYKNKKAAQKSE